MSTKDTWAKLGVGVHPSKLDPARDRSGETLHGVGAPPQPGERSATMQTPFGDTAWDRTEPMGLQPIGQMFEMGDVLLHVKTGGMYGVLDTPDSGLVIERTGERAYCYKQIDGDLRKWVRPQTEMEDGRFVMHRRAPSRR